MKKLAFLFVLFCSLCSLSFGFESYPVWPSTPPGDKAEQYEENGGKFYKPVLEWWQPEHQTSDACLIICCGGAYMGLAYDYEGVMPRDYFLSKGITVVMLRYRIPRREGVPKHQAAWQDVQRTIRFVRSHADEWKISPEKIGVMGFSAGGHLTLMAATTSQTPAYEPVDDLDKVPCHLNFAVPIYPAYVLKDGPDGANTGKGNDSSLVDDFAFDEKTPPMCLVHGDGDPYSAMGSITVYHKLRTMNIPAEVHVFALANHAFNNCGPDAPMRRYPDRVYDWLGELGFLKSPEM
ncbi:MAG: alpha/beta hydrolase [Planctomycetia bacterium]|nr:alpha/beta hydrolase [Planctomycetia bacterium]